MTVWFVTVVGPSLMSRPKVEPTIAAGARPQPGALPPPVKGTDVGAPVAVPGPAIGPPEWQAASPTRSTQQAPATTGIRPSGTRRCLPRSIALRSDIVGTLLWEGRPAALAADFRSPTVRRRTTTAQ